MNEEVDEQHAEETVPPTKSKKYNYFYRKKPCFIFYALASVEFLLLLSTAYRNFASLPLLQSTIDIAIKVLLSSFAL